MILSNTDSLPAMGMKKLAKLLYFADFNHYEENHESITSENYTRMDHGPMPESLYDAIDELDSKGLINAEKVSLPSGNEKWNFDLEKKADPEYLDPSHQERLLEVLEKLDHLNANELEELSHLDIPWQVTDDKDEIRYKLVFYRDEEIEEFFG